MTDFTLIDAAIQGADASERFPTHTVSAEVDGDRVTIRQADVRRALGWQLKEEGLCRGDVCIPVRDRNALISDDGVDLAGLADLIDRPLALDAKGGAAVLGESAGSRSRQLETLEAPDFALPDLSGKVHRLSDYRGKKVLLIAHASW